MTDLDIIRFLTDFWRTIAVPIDPADARSIVSAFGFFSGFLTYISTTVVSRKAFIRIHRRAVAAIGAQFVSLFLGILAITTHLEVLGTQDFLLKLSLGIWTASLVVLFWVIFRTIYVDRIKFEKPTWNSNWKRLFSLGKWRHHGPPFASFQDFSQSPGKTRIFGIECVDHHLGEATKRGDSLYFPILLIAKKHFRPWRICNRFAAAGLKGGEGVIYFGFNQPPDVIVYQIAKQCAQLDGFTDWKSWWEDNGEQDIFANLAIINCYSPWAGSSRGKLEEDPLISKLLSKTIQSYQITNPLFSKSVPFRSDPRDAIALAQEYKRALQKVRKAIRDERVRRLRVVYDSISDFVEYCDPQIAIQFIKHNMVWEDLNNANSLYLYIPNVPQQNSQNPIDEAFLSWNAYCEIHLETDECMNEQIYIDGLSAARLQNRIWIDRTSDYRRIALP